MPTSILAPDVHESLMVRWEPVYRSRLHYLVTWGTRGRRSVLRPRHIQSLESRLQSICAERGLDLREVSAGSDHVHVLMALKPSQSVASVIRELKGRTAMELLQAFPELRVWLRSNLLWDERYSVETVSAPRVDRVRRRLRALHGEHGVATGRDERHIDAA